MEDDGAWSRFETPNKRAVRVTILPEVAQRVAERAHTQGVSIETLVNVLLLEQLHEKKAS